MCLLSAESVCLLSAESMSRWGRSEQARVRSYPALNPGCQKRRLECKGVGVRGALTPTQRSAIQPWHLQVGKIPEDVLSKMTHALLQGLTFLHEEQVCVCRRMLFRACSRGLDG